MTVSLPPNTLVVSTIRLSDILILLWMPSIWIAHSIPNRLPMVKISVERTTMSSIILHSTIRSYSIRRLSVSPKTLLPLQLRLGTVSISVPRRSKLYFTEVLLSNAAKKLRTIWNFSNIAYLRLKTYFFFSKFLLILFLNLRNFLVTCSSSKNLEKIYSTSFYIYIQIFFIFYFLIFIC